MIQEKYKIDAYALKWIAMICMTIDHTGSILFPQYQWMRIIGRLAFPIYCFLLVEGAMHTHNIRQYELKVLLLSIVSEVMFDLSLYQTIWYPGHQNVCFTLLLGLLMIDFLKRSKYTAYKVITVVVAVLLGELCMLDYGAGGILFIFCFYVFYQQAAKQQIGFILLNFLYFGSGIQIFAGLAAFPMFLYNQKPGKKMKNLFYIYYPAHLLILYLIKRIITGIE
ncbi:MAG: TraX family protein [Lachnospiraceae bacterium]